MKKRTKDFAKRIIHLCRKLPQTQEGKLIGRQIFRSGTSVGANYRAACRGRSRADFLSKLGIVLEEADETLYWLELIVETNVIKSDLLQPLIKETNEIIAICVASLNNSRNKK